MSRQELMEEMEEIQLRWYNTFKGTNEADLMIREEIADLLLPLIASKEADKLSVKELREKQAWENGYQFRERMLKVQPTGISDKEIAESGRIFAEGRGEYEELLSLTYSQAARDMRDKFLSHYTPPKSN